MLLTHLGRNLRLILIACLAFGQAHAQKTEPLLFEHNAEIILAQFDETDNLIITASADGIVKLWDPESGRFIRSFGLVSKLSKNFFADFSPDGKLVASVNGRSGKIWNTKFGDIACNLSGYGDTIKSIHFSQNGKWLITSSLDGTARLWDIPNATRHHSLNHMFESLGKKGQQSGLTEAKFCDGDKSAVTGTGKVMWIAMDWPGDSTRSDSIAKNTNRDPKFAPHYDSTVLIWDLKTGKVAYSLKGYPFDVSTDGGHIVTGSMNISGQNARVWEVATGKLMLTLSGHTGKVTSCQFSHDGKRILTSSSGDGTCRIWDAVTGRMISSLMASPTDVPSTSQFSPDGKWISTFSQDTVKMWEATSGKLLRSIPAKRPLIFSNDSRLIVILYDKRASVYETISGKPILVEKKPPGIGAKKVLKVR